MIKIESALFSERQMNRQRWKPLLSTMTITVQGSEGPSFLVESKNVANSVRVCAHRIGINISIAKQIDGRYRIWRIK